jgi:NADPH2:quinone reductase
MNLEEVPLPEPEAGELRLRVEAAAVGLPDVMLCRGSYAFNPPLPFTPGQEVCGIVTAAGEGSRTPLGARVMAVTAFIRGAGGFAEEALVLDGSSFEAPTSLSAADAAGFTIPYHTAYLALITRAQLEAGETLVVLGAAGGSGSAALQLGRALGAEVIAVVTGSAKARACSDLGAHRVLDASDCNIKDEILTLTRGKGADVIFDPVGGESFQAALPALASEGRLLAVGFASGAWSDAATARLVAQNASVLGVYVGAYAKPFTDTLHASLLEYWAEKSIRSVVTTNIPFEELDRALEDLGRRRIIGKIVTHPGG